MTDTQNHLTDLQLWELVVADLHAKFPDQGSPTEYDGTTIRYVLNEIANGCEQRLLNEPDLAKKNALIPTASDFEREAKDFGKITERTFRNNFTSDRRQLKGRTLDAICVFLGYDNGKDYINKRAEDQRVDSNDEDIISAETEDNRKTKTWIPIVVAALFLVIGSTYFLGKKEHGSDSHHSNTGLFTANAELNILILPFMRVQGEEAEVPAEVKRNIEWAFPDDSDAEDFVEVQLYDSDITQYSPADMRRIGTQTGASVVFWGSYKAYGTDSYDQVLNYTFIDSTYERIAELTDQIIVSETGETMNYTTLTGRLDQIIYGAIGFIYSKQDNQPQALRYYEMANYDTATAPVGLLRMQAYAYYRTGQNEPAYLYNKAAVNRAETHRWTLNNQSIFARLNGHFNEAERAARKALEIDSTYYKAICSLANVYADPTVAEYGKAKLLYEKVLQLEPNDSITIWNLGETNYNLKDFEASLKYFEDYQKRAPEDPEIDQWLKKVRDSIATTLI